jgi:outer membrane protein TolC
MRRLFFLNKTNNYERLFYAAVLILCFNFPFISTPFYSFAAETGSREVRLMDVIRMAVEKDAAIKVYESREAVAAAGVLAAGAQFDPSVKASVSRSIDYTPLSEDQKKAYRRSGAPDLTKLKQGAFSYSAGYEKRYRSGISISPSVTVSTGESNDPQNRVPVTSGKVSFALIKPLGRGNGSRVNQAYEKSSMIEFESASFDSLYTVSQTVRGVILAYWNYAYAYKALKIAEDSKVRAEKIYNDTKTLVEGFEVPPAELDQLMANLNQKLAECGKASQNTLQALNSLKAAAGVSNDSSLIAGPPADFFPAGRISGDTLETSALAKTMLEFAMANRKDYAAAKKRLESYQFTIPAAKDALKPQTDLQIAAGYNGRKDDKGAAAILSSLREGVPGVNLSAAVSYSFPIGNKSARAEIIRQQEQLLQANIKAEEIARQMDIAIDTRVNAVASIINRYKLMIESGRLYSKALENEKEKHQMGVSTLMDVLNLEDRLGQAELALESAVFEYASAITELKFEAGCLGRMGTSECEIRIEDIISLPDVNNIEK